jgi:hypothetical protein
MWELQLVLVSDGCALSRTFSGLITLRFGEFFQWIADISKHNQQSFRLMLANLQSYW